MAKRPAWQQTSPVELVEIGAKQRHRQAAEQAKQQLVAIPRLLQNAPIEPPPLAHPCTVRSRNSQTAERSLAQAPKCAKFPLKAPPVFKV